MFVHFVGLATCII